MKGRVVVVEPKADLAESLQGFISTMNGFQVVGVTSSGLAAMKEVASLLPDLLILDFSLPDISGLEVVQWVGRMFPETRVVLISAHDLPEYRLAAARARAAAFINMAELSRKLPKVLARLMQEQAVRAGERGGVVGWLAAAYALPHLPRW